MSLCILITLPFDTRFSAVMRIFSVQAMKMVYIEQELLQCKGFETLPFTPNSFFFFLLYQVQASYSPLQDPP